MNIRLNINTKDFDKKFPGIRKKITKYLTRELENLQIIGFPTYDLVNIADVFIKNIINMLEEGD